MINVGIAREDSVTAAKHQHVQTCIRKTAPDVAHERRREQHIAETAQRHDQNAWPRIQRIVDYATSTFWRASGETRSSGVRMPRKFSGSAAATKSG